MSDRTAAVEEALVCLDVNGRRFSTWTCTPDRLEALAVGRLLAEGYLERPDDLLGVETAADDDGAVTVRVRLPAERVAAGDAERRHRLESGCGVLHHIRCAPERIRGRAGTLQVPPFDAFADLFRQLYAAAERYHDGGGMHSAALTDGERLFFQAEEVSRHNAVDKAIGAALLADRHPGDLGLVLSARISGEIALKAARAGLSWIASRSVPTTLAVRISETARLPLVARAAGKEPRIYA